MTLIAGQDLVALATARNADGAAVVGEDTGPGRAGHPVVTVLAQTEGISVIVLLGSPTQAAQAVAAAVAIARARAA